MLKKKPKKIKTKRESVERPTRTNIFNAKSEFRMRILEDLKHFKFSSAKSSLKILKPQPNTQKKKTVQQGLYGKLRKNSIECGKIKEKVLKKKDKIIRNSIARRKSLEMIDLSPIKRVKDISIFETSLARII
ncbi:hypothetical protein SteCoe_33703 [Stentor coeruleus]|uniref:Uncharacterized protein n=1 Tax=Stentor coeruleus TaxID=5963 RepID=A0A1R2AWB6_9CILI|nr:hypothetical protein SteCoe_33703 [Stentor coeruleus]